MLNEFSLVGKVALVTGAAGLLGEQHAIALRECGATLVMTDTNVDRLAECVKRVSQAPGSGEIIAEAMDVTQPQSVQSIQRELVSRCCHVSILVNNAAVDPKVAGEQGLEETSRLENFQLDDWNFQISVGLTGAFLASQVFGSAMAERGEGGVILNIASDLSVISPDQRLYRKNGLAENQQPVKPISYSVIKAGLVGMTKYLSTYWPQQNIRCNALSPGGVFNGQDDVFLSRLTPLIPLGRMASLDEYRGAVKFLCSDASKYMTGQNIVIDGGRSVW